MERAQFRGKVGLSQQENLQKMLEGGPSVLVQTPEQVAQEVVRAVERRRGEVMVGALYSLLGLLYRLIRFNLFTLPLPK